MIGGVVGDLMFCACAWSDRAEGILRHERYQAQNAEEHCQSECGKQNPPRAKSATIATRVRSVNVIGTMVAESLPPGFAEER